MNLRFVEAFVRVARLHSFKAAAEPMYTTWEEISTRPATRPPLAIRTELATGALRVPDVDLPLTPLPIVVSTQAGRTSPVTEDFAQMALEACGDFMQACRDYTVPPSTTAPAGASLRSTA